ncbi:hypothetical protein [Mesorhizobium sp. M1342]|uniref:hypothetical protein n=1 Tax=Mesorhizobium sp. M1342 TaxID=2957088 RepID=UPI00333CB758
MAPAVEEQFGFVEMQLLSIPDLYAGTSSRRSTGSIRAISSMSNCCSKMKG